MVWTNSAWVSVEDLRFISDPMLFGRHIVEWNPTDNAVVRTYVWGLDLSETMEAAGGVGGLLWVTLHTASGPAAGTHFCAHDGNGNVVALASATDGSPTARYEYAPLPNPSASPALLQLLTPSASRANAPIPPPTWSYTNTGPTVRLLAGG